MNNKDKKELDNIIQIGFPDDYYKEQRKLLFASLIKWHESKMEKVDEEA